MASNGAGSSSGPSGSNDPVEPAAELTWQQRKKERTEALKKLREEEKKALKATDKKGQQDRLAYLMRQADIFTHFVSDNSAAVASRRIGGGESSSAGAEAEGSGSAKGRRKKGRMSEKAEDDLLMAQAGAAAAGGSSAAGAEDSSTRLLKQPACIAHGKMRDYQLEGLNWLIKLHENGINGILADEMGLGKTLQTISLLGYLKESRGISGPHLVITPKSTLTNWANECARWCPSLRVIKFQGDKTMRAKVKAEHFDVEPSFDVCLMTYESVIQEQASIRKLVWRYLIIDEAHRIKNEQSVLSKVVRLFSTHFRLLITGTPLQNDLHELWAMLNFLLPDVFGDSDTFDAWFSGSGDTDAPSTDVLSQLHKILRPFLLRRLKADVEKDLPPKREINLMIGLSEMQRRWYSNILEKNIDVLNAMGANRTRMLNMLMQLRKCANHPYLFEGAETPPFTNDERLCKQSGKMALLDKLLNKLYKGGHRVLIFSQMTRMLDILEDYCGWREWGYCRLDGSTSGELRDEQMESFNAPGSKIFLFMLSTRAGGLGINLATADTVIIYDSDWNPQMDLQAMDRAHRIGQTKPVVVYRLITEGTVEEKIIERSQKKLYLDAAVIQQGRLAEQSKALSKDEILGMVRFGADAVFNAGDNAGDPTEEDIDALLERGEERTRNDTERLQKTANSLANFALGGEEKSLYEYEGKDYSKKGKLAWSLSLPKRVTKQNYDENEYYRNALHGKDPKGAPRPPKPLQVADFQFFDVMRLEELREVEMRNYEFRKAQYDKLRTAVGGSNVDPAEQEALEREMERVAPPLSEEQLEEKDRLMQDGFTQWSRRDLNNFIRGLEEYGRDDIRAVATYVDGKTDREVSKYATIFFKNYTQIKDWQKLMRRIEAGEQRILRRQELDAALKKKVAACPSAITTLTIDYKCLGGEGRGKTPFTVDNDRHLVCLACQCGYGQWEELQGEVRTSWLFKFDWFMKTRTEVELAKRVEYLAKLVEKELADEAEAARRAKRKRPGEDDGGNGGGKKRKES